MADIKYDIVEEIGVLSENAKGGEKKLIGFPGMEQLQNMISGIGLRNMKR